MKKLTCHCGGVEIEVNVPDQFKKIMRCNCSLCKRKGTIMTMVGPDDLKVVKGNCVHKNVIVARSVFSVENTSVTIK